MSEKVCILCQRPPTDFEEFLEQKGHGFHYLCLLLSPALYQRDENEDNGLYGFVLKDILKEERRISKQRCRFCHNKLHANLSCSVAKCTRSFHVDCGIQRGCQYQMTGNFLTFCHEHRKFEKPEVKHDPDDICAICMLELGDYDYNQSIYADCCKPSWYHRECLVKTADRAGFFFRCPLCKNEENFKNQVQQQGIFVMERDAAWEREPGAFADQRETPSTCNAEVCECPEGRSCDIEESDWELLLCETCAGEAIHVKCHNDDRFLCQTCAGAVRLDEIPSSPEVVEGIRERQRLVNGTWIDIPDEIPPSFSPNVQLGTKLQKERCEPVNRKFIDNAEPTDKGYAFATYVLRSVFLDNNFTEFASKERKRYTRNIFVPKNISSSQKSHSDSEESPVSDTEIAEIQSKQQENSPISIIKTENMTCDSQKSICEPEKSPSEDINGNKREFRHIEKEDFQPKARISRITDDVKDKKTEISQNLIDLTVENLPGTALNEAKSTENAVLNSSNSFNKRKLSEENNAQMHPQKKHRNSLTNHRPLVPFSNKGSPQAKIKQMTINSFFKKSPKS
ncbi:uncharacterized protein LOC134831179 [Culicoides brevitarsis]|uniref:uncharacterized protein LOC134831179 n=1 Tax=Culicoides brevitarsis TaxID=469753 RepID=UPI00307C83FE